MCLQSLRTKLCFLFVYSFSFHLQPICLSTGIDNRHQSITTRMFAIDWSSIININRLIDIDWYRLISIVIDWIPRDKRHRNLLRFLWPDGDIKAAPVEYGEWQFTFSVRFLSWCANFAPKRIATDHGEEFGNNAGNLARDNYVDDGLKSMPLYQFI